MTVESLETDSVCSPTIKWQWNHWKRTMSVPPLYNDSGINGTEKCLASQNKKTNGKKKKKKKKKKVNERFPVSWHWRHDEISKEMCVPSYGMVEIITWHRFKVSSLNRVPFFTLTWHRFTVSSLNRVPFFTLTWHRFTVSSLNRVPFFTLTWHRFKVSSLNRVPFFTPTWHRFKVKVQSFLICKMTIEIIDKWVTSFRFN